MSKNDFINAIKDKNIKKSKELNYSWSGLDVVELKSKDDLQFFIDEIYLADYEFELNDKLTSFMYEVITRDIVNGNECIISSIKMMNDIYTLSGVKFDNEEIIYQLFQYPWCQEVIKTFIDVGLEIPYFSFYELICLNNYWDLDYLFLDILLNNDDDCDDVFSVFLSNYASDGIIVFNKYYDQLIHDLINKHHCNINNNGCDSDFEYLIQNCLFRAPHSFKYFFKPELDSSPLEDEEFWELFSNEILNIDEYTQAFQDLKNSGIKFNDQIMLAALEEAGHQQLIDAYLN